MVLPPWRSLVALTTLNAVLLRKLRKSISYGGFAGCDGVWSLFFISAWLLGLYASDYENFILVLGGGHPVLAENLVIG